jgi:hypothetical protein
MTRPRERFGDTVVAFVRFTRPGHYAVMAGVRRGAELIYARFIVSVREVKVDLTVGSGGAPVAGEQTQLDAHIEAEVSPGRRRPC